MKSKARISILILIFALLVSACGPAVSTTPEPTQQTTDAAYPVTIEHKYGSTTIEKFPERIVLVGLTEQDAMLALGVVPVATSEWYGGHPGAIFEWATDKLGSAPVPVVLNSVEINFEQIAGLRPDLIVGLYAGLTQDVYDTLSKIAPTVAQPKEYVDYGIPWQELTRKIGLIVGKSAEAEALIANVEADFAAARTAHPDFVGKSGVVASTWGFADGNYYAYHSQDPRNRFMTSLGFTVPAEIDELAGKEYGATISLERLDIVDTDALVWITMGEKEVQEQKSAPLYSKTKATKEGRDIFLIETDPVYDALNFNTVLSLPFALEKMLPRLSAAVDGDPGTVAEGETSAAPAYPVTIAHKYGETTLTKFPERIVLVGLTEQDALLALGIVPVATREWWGERPGAIFEWAKDELGNAPLPTVLPGTELNFEQIASLRPDVIVGLYAGLTQEEYDTLSKIAPTVAQPGEYPDWGIPWPDLTRTIGQIVGKSAQAEALISNLEARFATVRTEHPEFANSVGIVAADGESDYWAYNSKDPRGQFLTSLGFKPSAALDKLIGNEFGATVSRERFDLVNEAGVLIWFANDAEKVKSDTLYQQLDVIRQGRDIVIPWDAPMAYAFSFNTVLSLPYVLDKLVPQIVLAVDGDPATTSGTPASAGDVFPVTIENKFGSTVIPAEPQRVVSLGYSEQDAILALGVTPIAIRNWFGDQPYGVWPWSKDALGDAKPELINMEFGELNFETLASLKPDLIVATHSGITEDEYKKLVQIAPTLAQPAKYDDFATPWQEQTLLIGQALGRSDKAKALVAETEAKIDAAAAAYPEFAQSTIAWLTPTEGPAEYWVVGPNTPPLRFLQKLGFEYPTDVATLVGTASSGKLSTERLDMVDTGVLIMGGNSQREAILADPLFQQLKASKEGRVLFFGLTDPVYGALSFSTVASLSYAVDHLVPQLAAAVDGDPSTK